MADPDPILGLIVTTDASCKIKGQSWAGIPTLVWPEGIDEVASDWFRMLVINFGVAPSSAREYAKILRPFLRFCRRRGRSWQSVDDEFLILWREHLRRAEGISISRTNASLKTIFAFYRWAEENKRLRFQVGIYAADELPPAIADTTFPISAKRSFTKGRHGRVYGSWTTPLTLSEPNQGSRLRHTPTESEIRKLHEITVEREHGERDSLMFSWAEEAGPRRAEFLRLGKSHLPTNDQLADVIERDEPWPIVVPRKGGKETPIYAPPDLIIRTLDYIQYGRRDIVERCLRVKVGYREPDEIFLSGSTGQALHVDSVTAIGRKMFSKAGIKGANVHRLRARHAVTIVEALVEGVAIGGDTLGPGSTSIETILTKAAELMGHTSPQSLRPYLTYVLNRRIQTADATKAQRLASRLRQMQLLEGTFVRRLKHHHDFQRAASQLQAGRDADAALTLRSIADQIDQEQDGPQTSVAHTLRPTRSEYL